MDFLNQNSSLLNQNQSMMVDQNQVSKSTMLVIHDSYQISSNLKNEQSFVLKNHKLSSAMTSN